MAAKDVAQRPLNLTTSGGQATASSDAAHVTVATTPADVAAAAALGASFDAARTDHAHRGTFTVKKSGSANIFGTITLSEGLGINIVQAGNDLGISVEVTSKLSLDDHWTQTNIDAGAEFIIMEWNANFDDITVTANIAARISSIIGSSGGGTNTVRLRIGGTLGGIDGTVRATISSASAAGDQQTNLGASFVNPGGEQVVKVTMQNSGVGNTNSIRGTTIVIG